MEKSQTMKHFVVKILAVTVLLTAVLSAAACGDRTSSYAMYDFVCEGSMTVTHQPVLGKDSQPMELSDEDVHTLIGLWSSAWKGGQNHACFNYAFQWEDTTIRYCSAFGVFEQEATGLQMKLSREDRETMESLIEGLSA